MSTLESRLAAKAEHFATVGHMVDSSDPDVLIPIYGTGNAAHVKVVAGPEIDTVNGVAVVEQGQFLYETVAASQTDQVLGGTGAAGDFIHRLVITLTAADATAAVTIKDGAGSAIPVVPPSPASGIGVLNVEMNVSSMTGAWSVTTLAGATVIAIGRFSA